MFTLKTRHGIAPQMNIASQFLIGAQQFKHHQSYHSEYTEDFSKYLAAHSASDGIVIPENFSAELFSGAPC